jgi:hypothetical protein
MNSAALVTLLLGVIDRAAQISSIIQLAKAQNRDVTQAELDMLLAQDLVARQRLVDAINASSGGATAVRPKP